MRGSGGEFGLLLLSGFRSLLGGNGEEGQGEEKTWMKIVLILCVVTLVEHQACSNRLSSRSNQGYSDMMGKSTSLWLRLYHLQASLRRKIHSEYVTVAELRG